VTHPREWDRLVAGTWIDVFADRDGETVAGNPSAFDFNGDGRFDVVDVQALFAEIGTS
jgi:hypothetical protein